MARKLRIQYEGAIYHVMNRGDRREDIFHNDADRELFLKTFGQACVNPSIDHGRDRYWPNGFKDDEGNERNERFNADGGQV
ncbi:MAG TPA: hypothetical protein VK615_08675 [Candidatus Binatia bacterium]|nr:hypothetical protein [Candidatus Binatia bacterium]